MKKYLSILIVIFFSCNTNSGKPISPLENENKNKNEDNTQLAILGNWGGETGNPVWGIRLDSIYYFSEKQSYRYSITNEDMIVQYKEGPYVLRNIHVIKDTLFFATDYGGIIKAFRK